MDVVPTRRPGPSTAGWAAIGAVLLTAAMMVRRRTDRRRAAARALAADTGSYASSRAARAGRSARSALSPKTRDAARKSIGMVLQMIGRTVTEMAKRLPKS